MKKLINYLKDGAMTDIYLSDMWKCVEDGDFHSAMHCQILHLYHRDQAYEAVLDIDTEDFNLLINLTHIASTGKPLIRAKK